MSRSSGAIILTLAVLFFPVVYTHNTLSAISGHRFQSLVRRGSNPGGPLGVPHPSGLSQGLDTGQQHLIFARANSQTNRYEARISKGARENGCRLAVIASSSEGFVIADSLAPKTAQEALQDILLPVQLHAWCQGAN